ncbi:hypothetical protein DN390_29635 [Bacillus sp. SH7-1]|uniref:hypothetical protein n=1 Tax=Bacillus sp. SH7-1 TaxID=2217818 RepID=UPI0011CC6B9E|nr:hypothetical protein [Bacillus sp. SH7-1]TXR91218.1 hypothetical protein DN390_29635 [Bacillus sp. SH7-1]
MISNELESATHWWFVERRKDSFNESMYTVLPFIFKNLDALYIITRNIPREWTKNELLRGRVNGTRSKKIILPNSLVDYINLRSSLSFVSDLHLLLKTLIEEGNLMDLEEPIEHLYNEISKFRDVRNFFTHLDERLLKLEKHGVSGKNTANCGIEYGEDAVECFHLVLSGNKIHFTQNKKLLEAEVGRDAFNAIFRSCRGVYEVLINHRIHATNYKSFKEIYSID